MNWTHFGYEAINVGLLAWATGLIIRWRNLLADLGLRTAEPDAGLPRPIMQSQPVD